MLRANMLATEYVCCEQLNLKSRQGSIHFNAKLCRAGISYIAYNHYYFDAVLLEDALYMIRPETLPEKSGWNFPF